MDYSEMGPWQPQVPQAAEQSPQTPMLAETGQPLDQQEGGRTEAAGMDIPEACRIFLDNLPVEETPTVPTAPAFSRRQLAGVTASKALAGSSECLLKPKETPALLSPPPSELAPANDANLRWRKRFNLVILNDIMQELKKRLKGKADPFMNQVDPHTAPDYRDFVAPKDEMWLNAIASKVDALAYFTTEQFASDIRQIVANSEAYNSPGAGKCGGPDFTHLSRELLETYTIIVAEHAVHLSEAEAALWNPNCPACPEEPPPRMKRLRIKRSKEAAVQALPLGVQHTIRCMPSHPGGNVQYSLSCPRHGTRLVPSLPKMAEYFDLHARCREEWHGFARHIGEVEVDYRQRLHETFCFRRDTPPNSTTLRVTANRKGVGRSVAADVIHHDSNPLSNFCQVAASKKQSPPDMAVPALTGHKRKQREDSRTLFCNPRVSTSSPQVSKGDGEPKSAAMQECLAAPALPGLPILAHAKTPTTPLFPAPAFRTLLSGSSVAQIPSPIKVPCVQKLEFELHAAQAAVTHAGTSLRKSAAAITILAVLQAASAARQQPLQEEVQALTIKLGAVSSALAAAEAKNETCVRAVGVMAVLYEAARAKKPGQGDGSMGRLGSGSGDSQGKQGVVERKACQDLDSATPALSSAKGGSQKESHTAWNAGAGAATAPLAEVEQIVEENRTLKEAVQDLGYEKALLVLQKEQAEIKVARLEAKVKAFEGRQG